MLAQLVRKVFGKPEAPPTAAELFVGRQQREQERQLAKSQPYGPCAAHEGHEPYREFRACDAENQLTGNGSLFENGDVVIQWFERGHLELPAGCDWQRYFVEWK